MKKRTINIALWVILALAFVVFSIADTRKYEVTAKVGKILTEQQLQSEEGLHNIVTRYYVTTEQGLYEIRRSGFWRCDDFCNIKRGTKYRFTCVGVRSNFLGMYPVIIKADEIK